MCLRVPSKQLRDVLDFLVLMNQLLTAVYASPVHDLGSRDLTAAECCKVVVIVDVLKIQKATPFCSSFLSIKPATSTATVTVTSTKSVGCPAIDGQADGGLEPQIALQRLPLGQHRKHDFANIDSHFH